MPEGLKTFGEFLKVYAIFTIIMLLLDLSSGVNIFPAINLPSTLTIPNIIGFFKNVGVFVISLLFYSIPGVPYANILLWVYRSIAILELLLYLKKLGHPTSV